MSRKVREDALKTILAAAAAAAVFEILCGEILGRWLGDLWVFRHHLPTLGFFSTVLFLVGINFYEYNGFGLKDGTVRQGADKPYIAITFDDGPHPQYTPKILEILKEKQVPATFFMVGRHILKYPDIAMRVRAEGHDVGNHTFSHRDMVAVSRKTILKEVNDADTAIRKILGIRTKLFRPPRGLLSAAAKKLLVENGYKVAYWTVSAQDWRRDTPKTMVKRILRHIRYGGIILFHDSGALLRSEGGRRACTIEALPMVIDELRAGGFQIVRLSQMINDLDQSAADRIIESLSPVSARQEA